MSSVETLDSRQVQQLKPGDPCTLVLFGAGGDLTKRKLFPALYNLAASKILPQNFAVLGIDRMSLTTAEFRAAIKKELPQFNLAATDPAILDWLTDRIHYLPGDFNAPDTFSKLKETLPSIDAEFATGGNHLFYLATPPRFFAEIAEHLGAAGLTSHNEKQWSRLIIEKPFGNSRQSATELNAALGRVMKEEQIFRIDHYLGKETVQNILVFRFENGLFEPIWNSEWIDNIQITAAESVGVESRGGYYDASGALRDMVQNHLFQVLNLTAMDSPLCMSADAIRDAKREVITKVRLFNPDNIDSCVVRGQYAAGTVKDRAVLPYREEPSVSPDSNTETFVALKLAVDNDRWRGVPFYLRTGKSLPRRVSEVAIQFKHSPFKVCHNLPERTEQNRLIIRIQPDEGIDLHFGAKVPGPVLRVGMVDMSFCYRDYFGVDHSSGYETLLYDCMVGDATLFARADNLETGWGVVDPILDHWREQGSKGLHFYGAGTWGPPEADSLLQRDGRCWRNL